MRRRTCSVIGFLAIALVLGHTTAGLGQTLSGRAYEGGVGDESDELPGVTVSLYGAPEAGGPRTHIVTQTTAANGWYGLPVAEGFEHYYIVAESGPDFTYTFEGATSVGGTASGNEIHYSTLNAPLDDQIQTGNKFWYKKEGGEPPQDKGILDGYKREAGTGNGLENWRIFIDLNNDGEWNPGEPSDLTDGNGYYRIDEVEPGTYRVCEEMQPGWEGDEPCVEGITVLGGVTTTQDFHNRKTQPPNETGSIRGTKFNDLNGNGQRDPGEPGLSGWQIILQDANGNVLAIATTDANGNYAFTGLQAGSYEVDEAQQDGWRQTYPEIDGESAVWVIGLEPQVALEEIDFGNVREETPLEYEEEHGDAPQPYGDLYLSVDPTALLGSSVDGEPVMQRDPHALGDDNDGNDDEDGVAFITPLIPGQQATVRIDLTQVTAPDWLVRGHIDFNQNGSWDTTESIISSTLTAGIVNVVTFTVPTGALTGSTFARFYIANAGPEPPWGLPFGEVEDYEVTIDEGDPTPNWQVDVFAMCLRIEMDIPGIGLVRTSLSGPAKQHVFFDGLTFGKADDSDFDGRDDVPTELVELNLAGVDPVVGAVRMHVDPTKPSTGEIEERLNSTPGTLDVPPYTASGTADSFFDVYVEIELPDLGICLRAEKPIRLEGVISHVPPAGADAYTPSLPTTMPLFKGPCGGGTWPAHAATDPADAFLLSLRSCQDVPGAGEYDFGDAPDSYKTLHTSGGPYHDTGPVMLGNSVDAEPDGQPGPLANLDSSDDGVLLPLGLQVDQFATVLTYVNAPVGVPSALVGWIDYDQNGAFKDPEERFVTINSTGAGVPVALTETINVPSTAKSGWTYARFRIYRTQVGVAILPSPAGYGEEGEVEDYRVEIKPRGDIPPAGHIITGIKFNDLDGDGLWEPGDGEARLPNWTIWLDTNGDGLADQTTTTDGSGGFEFPPVAPGTYTIGEKQQPGWTQTAPAAPGTLTFTVPGGPLPTISFCMFGNRRTSGSGSVTVVKKALPADDTPFDFAAHTPGGFFDVLVNKLSDPSGNTWSIGDLDRLQKVVEAVPAGWILSDITVTGDADHGSSVDLANATVYVDYDEGEDIVIVFTNTKIPSRGEYDFGDAPVSYSNAWHTLNDNLTMGPTIDAEAGPNYSSDATGDDTHQTDDEDGMTLVTSLKWGAPANVCVEVHNNDSNPSDVTIAGWIDFDGNGQWEPIADHIGTRSVHLPPFSIVKECWTFTVPHNAKPGNTFARFRLYRDDPNPLAIPFAVLPTGDGGEGEVEDYRVYILSDAPGPDDDLDYGDAPSSYGSSSHDVGRLRIGDLIDGEGAPNYSANADGDDLDNMPDEDGVSLKSDLVPGQSAGLTIKLTTAPGSPDAHSTAWVAVWLDFNQDGQFQDLTEVITPYTFVSVLTPQYELRLYYFTVPPTAKTGTTFMRVRAAAHPGPLGQQWSSTGHGGEGEVEDYQVTIKNDGQVVPPGQILGGLKFNDLNGNGHLDAGEPGLANWTIWIDLNGNGVRDAGEGTLTNPDGSFYFTVLSPGTYTVHEELQNGWQQTYPGGAGTHTITVQAGQTVGSVMFGNRETGTPAPGGIVHGYKWNDLDGDGIRDVGEPWLAGWTLWLDTNNDGKQDAGDMYDQTDATGHFRFAGVPAGTYTLGEQLQAGWTQTAPGGAGTYTVAVQAGQGTFPMMFGNRQSDGATTDGKICGSKWNDLNGDGSPDAAEPWLANWKVYLDLDLNRQWDAGEPFRLTDAAGSFEFTGLPVGSYTVAEEMQPGWSQTWPGGAGTHVIQIQPGVQPACVLFGNRQGGPGPDGTFDWGDAPDPTYPTLRASNGAYHVIVPGFHLGGSVDDEPDGLPSPDALGDDNIGADDEDGVAFLTPILPGDMAGLEIVASAAGFVDAWIDFDGDGTWSQPGDQILASEPVAAGANVLSVVIPASAQLNIATFTRFRLSRTGGLPPDGPGQEGEVEDYHILLGEEGPGVPGEVERPHLKWSQPPIEIDPNLDAPPVFCGWGEVSTSAQDLGGRRSWSMRVDDFHCLGPIPITRIRWWGSYKAWESVELPAVLPDHWQICFWANEPDDLQEDPFLPERVVHTLYVAPERVHIEPVGPSEFPDDRSEMCFAYELTLEPHEFFHQAEFPADEQVFWISITAVYPEGASRQNGWRWMTRPAVWGRSAEGFVLYDEGPDAQPSLFSGLFSPVFRASPCDGDEGYDLCFELLTDEPWVKWDQPFTGIRDWPHYEDVESQGISIRQEENIGRVVADDWLCERDTPVIAAAWWGSYIGYGYEACACEDSREPPRPDYFLLRMWTDHAEVPGEVIWEYRAYDYDEVLVGYGRHPEGEPNEPVFRYSVRLPEDSWFRQSGADGAYWFSVTAVYTDPLPMILHPWGWTSHRHVFGSPALIADGDPPSQWREPHSSLWPADMSFTLFTVPQSGPIAHWRFDESEGDIAFDSAGESHGTVYGGTWTEGVIHGAIRLDGLDDYIDCGRSDALAPEQMTLTMWLFPEHMGGMRWLLSRARTETDIDYGVKRHLEGQIEFVVVPEQGDPVSLISHETVPLNAWSHVAAICDGEQLSLCINGQPDGTVPCPPRPLRTGHRLVIGSLLGKTRFYYGLIDDVQLHGVPLPPEQIAEIAGN